MKPTRPKQAAKLSPVWIVGDGAMAHGHVSHGRNVPVLIVDATNVRALDEVIRSHRHLSPGDVSTDWGMNEREPTIIFLLLKFHRPVVAECAVAFKMPQHAGLVDQVLIARSLYLQTGKLGDRLANTFDSPRLLVEVIEHPKFASYWEYLYPRVIARKEGYSILHVAEKKNNARAASNESR